MDIPWGREERFIKADDGYCYSPLVIHPEDAAKRGIKQHDIVMCYNQRGGVLFAAVVTEEVAPRSVYSQQGGPSDCIIPRKLNRGGEANDISSCISAWRSNTPAHSGFYMWKSGKVNRR